MCLHLALHFSQLPPEGVKISTSGRPPPPLSSASSGLRPCLSILSIPFTTITLAKRIEHFFPLLPPTPFHGRVQHSPHPSPRKGTSKKGKQSVLGEGRRRGLTTGEQLKTTGWLPIGVCLAVGSLGAETPRSSRSHPRHATAAETGKRQSRESARHGQP